MTRRRVAVTGLGLVSAVGADRESSWRAMCEGRCGIGELTLFAGEGYRSKMVAEVRDDPGRHFSPRARRRYSRADQFAVLATSEALDDAGLLRTDVSPASVGVLLGVGANDLLRHESYYARVLAGRRPRPSEILTYLNGASVDAVAAHFGLTGLRACVNSACSSGTIAIGYAADLVATGQLEAAVCGGSDSLCRTALSGFNALRLVDTRPCRPFDVTRSGMSVGEGAGVLVLEDLDRARTRGARVYAELAGYAAYCEAYHATAPVPDGGAVAALIEATLEAAGVSPDEVDHVNAHGTGTTANDKAEAMGIRRVFGDRAAHLPVTSIKSMVGHCLGAAGAVEAVALALTIDRGVIPPTVNHGETDPDCRVVDVVANEARRQPVACGVSVSLAFGGNDAAIVMRRPN